MVKVKCQLCYRAILLIVKMAQLLNCFWCCRIVNESKYLAGSHSLGFPECETLGTGMTLMGSLEIIAVYKLY